MKKLFLTAAGLFLAATAQADTPPVVATATPTTTVVTSGEYVATTPARRGLFGRMRSRRATTPTYTTSTPVTTTVAPATTTPAAPTPMPMGGKVSSSSTPSTGIVQTSGTTPMTTTMPMTSAMPVMSSTVVMPMSTTSTTRPMRMGLLRSRMLYYR